MSADTARPTNPTDGQYILETDTDAVPVLVGITADSASQYATHVYRNGRWHRLVAAAGFAEDFPACFTSRGSRDLMWCWHTNEPYIIKYDLQTDQPCCEFCGSDPDSGNHTFILHVHKPKVIR